VTTPSPQIPGPPKPGLFGKHPARGDFLDSGLSPAVIAGLERWLDGALADCRTLLSPQWEGLWDAAQDDSATRGLCFWVGEGLTGGEVLAGVLRPSRDKVGRRYPLLLLIAAPPATAPLPPLLEDPSPWIDPLIAHSQDLARREAFDTVPDLLTGLDLPAVAQGSALAGASDLVALRPDGDTARLFADSMAADYRRAAAQRSYWWQSNAQETRLYTAATLPGGQALAWFLTAPRSGAAA
jgi:type VI secretion system protein ImpM